MAQWASSKKDMPDDVREDENGELRIVRSTARKPAPNGDMPMEETARRPSITNPHFGNLHSDPSA